MKKVLLIVAVVLVPVFLGTILAAPLGLITLPGQCRDDVGQVGACPPEYTAMLKSYSFYTANSTFSFALLLDKTYCNCQGSPRPVTLPVTISKVVLSGVGHNWTGSAWNTFATMPNETCVGNFTPLNVVGDSVAESCSISGFSFVLANSTSTTPQPYYILAYTLSFSDGQTYSGAVESQ